MSEELSYLSKTNTEEQVNPSGVDFDSYKKEVNKIFETLKVSTNNYCPQKTIKSIDSYLTMGIRFCYFEVTNIVYSLSEEERGMVEVNLNNLITYMNKEENNVSNEVSDVVIRLWDHYNLSCCQTNYVKASLEKNIVEIKKGLHKELHEELHKELHNGTIVIMLVFLFIAWLCNVHMIPSRTQ